MPPDLAPQSSGSTSIRRIAVLAFGAAVFFGVASVVKPPPQSAEAGFDSMRRTPETSRLAADAPRASAHAKGWRLLGTLEGREQRVLCFASPDGPRYSVHTLDGALLVADLPADEVYRLFPEIDLENMRLEPGADGPLMLMDRD